MHAIRNFVSPATPPLLTTKSFSLQMLFFTVQC